MPLMDMRRLLIQMKRPVQNMHMFSETSVKALTIIIEYIHQDGRRGFAALFSDLVDRFLRAGPPVFQQSFRSTVPFGMAGFPIPLILTGDEVGIAFRVELLFNIRE